MPALGVKVAVQWIWSPLVNGPRLPFCTVTPLLSKVLTGSVKVIVTSGLSPMARVSWLMRTEAMPGATVSTR